MRRLRLTRALAVLVGLLLAAVVPALAQTDPTATAQPRPNATPSPTTAPTPSPSTSSTQPTTLTMADAVTEAAAAMPEPPPVYDLTDPGVVYGRLQEGVNAWLATLGGNHDQWGNETGGVYSSAVRPDSVPASLQAFLLQYYQGAGDVGLAFGPEGVIEATTRTQTEYNDAVVARATELVEESAAAVAAAAANNAANNAENVPPLNNNDNGSGNGTNNNTTPPPTLPPPASSTEAAIEQQFAGVDIQAGDKAFTEEELGYVQDMLSKLPPAFWQAANRQPPEDQNPLPTRLRRMASIVNNGSPCFGVFDPSPPEHLEVSDLAYDQIHYDFPAPPFSDDEGRHRQFAGTLAHELLHRYVTFDGSGQYIGDIADKPKVAGWAQQFGWSVDGSGGWTCSQTNACVTDYASSVNPEEDMAESVMMYLYWPNQLKAVSQAKYDFIRSQLGIAETDGTHPATR